MMTLMTKMLTSVILQRRQTASTTTAKQQVTALNAFALIALPTWKISNENLAK